METRSVVKVSLRRIDLNRREIDEIIDEVANEVVVNVYVHNKLEVSLSTSPHMFLELGLGYALVHGLYVDEGNIFIKDLNIILNNVVKRGALCSCREDVSILNVQGIYRIYREVMDRANLFRRTGCFHVAAIVSLEGHILEVVEDISRHCALYKVIGRVFQRGIDFSKSMVVMSSRASSELMEGIASLCIPIAVFRGAPTAKAIEVARKNLIILIAHVKGFKMNVYTGFERINIPAHG